MVQVMTMPPVQYTARAQGLEDARSYSSGITGKMYSSQYRPARRMFDLSIHGIGTDLAGEAYIQQLKRNLDAVTPLVLIEVQPDGWHLAMDAARAARGPNVVNWTYGGLPVTWTFQNMPVTWWYTDHTVTVGNDNGGHFIEATFPTPNATVAYVGERVVQGGIVGRVVGNARTDASGDAKIYVDTAFADGIVQISPREWVTCFVTSMPDTVQPAGGGYGFQWTMQEAFESEYDGFEVVQPWR